MQDEPAKANISAKRIFIWKNGVRNFGVPVALLTSVWIQVRNAEPGTPAGAMLLGIIVGTAAGAILGGSLFGWIMWSFFGPHSEHR